MSENTTEHINHCSCAVLLKQALVVSQTALAASDERCRELEKENVQLKKYAEVYYGTAEYQTAKAYNATLESARIKVAEDCYEKYKDKIGQQYGLINILWQVIKKAGGE
ncbi:MAG: hypothetical protein ACYDG4_13315 [Desulfuromonadaceae bacterium]